MLIGAPGAQRTAGRAVSLLVACAPAGLIGPSRGPIQPRSHLSRCSRRTLNNFPEYAHARENVQFIFEESSAFRSNQRIAKINNVL